MNTCSCGHDKNHPLVKAKYKYSLWGWFVLMWGITAEPIETNYECQKCGQRIPN